MSSVQWYAEETPSCWTYSTSPAKSPEKKGWTKPKSAKSLVKEDIGPGKYTDGLSKAYIRTMSASVSHAFPKCKGSNSIHQQARLTKNVPGVGAYKDLEKGYHMVQKKVRATVILPYRSKGFADDIIRRSKEIPGPGAYYVGPPIKKY